MSRAFYQSALGAFVESKQKRPMEDLYTPEVFVPTNARAGDDGTKGYVAAVMTCVVAAYGYEYRVANPSAGNIMQVRYQGAYSNPPPLNFPWPEYGGPLNPPPFIVALPGGRLTSFRSTWEAHPGYTTADLYGKPGGTGWRIKMVYRLHYPCNGLIAMLWAARRNFELQNTWPVTWLPGLQDDSRINGGAFTDTLKIFEVSVTPPTLGTWVEGPSIQVELPAGYTLAQYVGSIELDLTRFVLPQLPVEKIYTDEGTTLTELWTQYHQPVFELQMHFQRLAPMLVFIDVFSPTGIPSGIFSPQTYNAAALAGLEGADICYTGEAINNVRTISFLGRAYTTNGGGNFTFEFGDSIPPIDPGVGSAGAGSAGAHISNYATTAYSTCGVKTVTLAVGDSAGETFYAEPKKICVVPLARIGQDILGTFLGPSGLMRFSRLTPGYLGPKPPPPNGQAQFPPPWVEPGGVGNTFIWELNGSFLSSSETVVVTGLFNTPFTIKLTVVALNGYSASTTIVLPY